MASGVFSERRTAFSIGTSAVVYPAADLARTAGRHGAKVAEINRQGALIARRAADGLDGFVAGSIGPLGRGKADLTPDQAKLIVDTIGPRLRSILESMPGAVIAATVAPIVLHGGVGALLAVLAAALAMLVVRNDVAAVVAGGAGAAGVRALGF